MAKASIWLKSFDRNRKFVAKKVMRVAGVDLGPGDPFDPSWVNTRRLRQLYESRKIVMVEGEEGVDAPAPIVIPDDWRELPWGSKDGPSLRALALSLNHGKLKNKDEAIAIVEAELARRAAAAPPAPPAAPESTGDAEAPIIPEGWRDLPWLPKEAGAPTLRQLAAQFAPVKNKVEAIAAIEAELARRETELGDATRDDKKPEAVIIPEGWAMMSMDERVKLANELKVVDEIVTDAEEADALIELEIERRAGEANGQPD